MLFAFNNIKKEKILKKHIKATLKYILILIITVSILLTTLILTANIPKEKIENNLEESLEFYKGNLGIEEVLKRRDYTFLHYYADSILLNIIYSIDTENPVESVMWSKYYEEVKMDVNDDFITVVEEKKEPNQQYLRYWHGSMTILRPLLTIFNIKQIYRINQIAMWSLVISLLVVIYIKNKKLAIIYILAMIMVAFPMVPLCFEYSWTFYIMLITSIIAILIEKRGDNGLFVLFFISGILTCFFDFLTTELITILIPVLLVLFIRKEENRLENFKKTLLFVIRSCILWGIAYISMWFAKWVLASIILNINFVDYVKDNAQLRINGLQNIESTKKMYWGAIFKNWHNLYPINIIKRDSHLIGILIAFLITIIVMFDWKNIKKKWFSAIILMIAITPYIRYLVLANHSYRHAFFTFRNQIITIISIGIIFIDCLNYKLLLKKVEIKGAKHEKSRTNNINTMFK